LESHKIAQPCIIDRQTKKIQVVALPADVDLMLYSPVERQPLVDMPMAWSSPAKLMFSGTPKSKTKQDVKPRPNIYETSQGKTHLAIRAAYAPAPSPDGRWVAFFGWPEAENVKHKEGQPSQSRANIYLYDRLRHKRIFVRSLPDTARGDDDNLPPFQVLQWTPDSRRLIISEENYNVAHKAGEETLTVSVLKIPVTSPSDNYGWAKDIHLITTFRISDTHTRYGSRSQPLQVSLDGNHLLLEMYQVIGNKDTNDNGRPMDFASQTSLQRLNLTTGQVDVVARFNNERLGSFDWHEENR